MAETRPEKHYDCFAEQALNYSADTAKRVGYLDGLKFPKGELIKDIEITNPEKPTEKMNVCGILIDNNSWNLTQQGIITLRAIITEKNKYVYNDAVMLSKGVGKDIEVEFRIFDVSRDEKIQAWCTLSSDSQSGPFKGKIAGSPLAPAHDATIHGMDAVGGDYYEITLRIIGSEAAGDQQFLTVTEKPGSPQPGKSGNPQAAAAAG